MADRNELQKMRQDMLDVGIVDQNGHVRRKPDGSVLFQTDQDGKDTPFQVSKAGIVPPIEKLVPRTRAVKRSFARYPLDAPHSMEAIAEANGDRNKSPWLNMTNFANNPPHGKGSGDPDTKTPDPGTGGGSTGTTPKLCEECGIGHVVDDECDNNDCPSHT